jgi:hypothetical protein
MLGLGTGAYVKAMEVLSSQFTFSAAAQVYGVTVSDLVVGELTYISGLATIASANCTIRMNMSGSVSAICFGYGVTGGAVATPSAFLAPYIAIGANANLLTGVGASGTGGNVGVLILRIS